MPSVHWKQIEKEISLLKGYQQSIVDLDVAFDVQPSPYSENAKNSMENTTKVILDTAEQNYKIDEISDTRKEHIYQVQRIDTNENNPKCLYGDTEEKNLILEDDIAETEKITEPFQEDANTDTNSEGDRLANLLLSISEFRVDATNIDYKEETNLIKQPKKQEEEREISNIEDLKTSTFFQTDDNLLLKNHNENIGADLNNTKDVFQGEDDCLADLLISMSKCRLDSTGSEISKHIENIKSFTTLSTNIDIQDYPKYTTEDEMKICNSQKQQFKTEEINFNSTETEQLNYDKEIRNNNTSVVDLHTERKVGKNRPYWNHEIGVHFLNFLIDSSMSHSMLHPNNYLFNLVKKL